MHSVFQFIFCKFSLREFTVSSLGKRSVISVSQGNGVKDRRISSKMFDLEML